jgi:2-C-methyl-D-erythritol 2,4-cyclodiphosphate synthase
MFERYSMKARQVFFWAQSAAESESEIRPNHLLVGVHQVVPELFEKADLKGAGLIFPPVSDSTHISGLTFFRLLLRKSRQGKTNFRQVALSEEAKNALHHADKVSRKLGSKTIGSVHLLSGVFHADEKLREQLRQAGLDAAAIGALCEKYEASDEAKNADELLSRLPAVRSSRSGIGYDLHRLAEGRKLIIGGIELPFEKGSMGHSDGDVLAHAICDAVLGAAGLGDIGAHFPDTDPKWKGVSSLLFLEHLRGLLDEQRLVITHIDAIVICERPKLAPHFPAIREALAGALAVRSEQINLKAKTNEGVDAVGLGEAIAAHAIATLESSGL